MEIFYSAVPFLPTPKYHCSVVSTPDVNSGHETFSHAATYVGDAGSKTTCQLNQKGQDAFFL